MKVNSFTLIYKKMLNIQQHFFSFFIKCHIICESFTEYTPDNNYADNQLTVLNFNQYIIEKTKKKKK